MLPDPNCKSFDPDKEKTRRGKLYHRRTIRTQLNPNRRKQTYVQIEQRGPVEDLIGNVQMVANYPKTNGVKQIITPKEVSFTGKFFLPELTRFFPLVAIIDTNRVLLVNCSTSCTCQ